MVVFIWWWQWRETTEMCPGFGFTTLDSCGLNSLQNSNMQSLPHLSGGTVILG